MVEKILIPTALIVGINPTAQISNNQTNFVSENDFYNETSCFTKEEIQKKVIAIVSEELGIHSDEIKITSSFTNDLGADSLDTIGLIIEFEKEFDIEITSDKIDKIERVKDAVDYIFEQYKNAISLFSGENFEGNKRCILGNTTEYEYNTKTYNLIDEGLSSLIIPSGHIVTLYTQSDYKGESAKITAKESRIEIKKVAKLKKHKNIEISNEKVKWNDNVKSIKIEAIK